MKRIAIVFALLISLSGHSQVWFDLGLKGGVGTGFLINKTLSSDPRLSISPGFNNFYGGKVGVNIGEMVGFTFDFTLGDNKYTFLQSDLMSSTTSFKYVIQYKSFNIAPLFRFTKESSYIELGPQFSFLRSGTISNGTTLSTPTNAEDHIRDMTTKMIFGFGGHMIGNEKISLMMGLRFSYMISNLANDTYAGTTWPFDGYFDITESEATHPMDVQVVFELNYSLGYFVRSSCGRRTAFLTF